MNAATPHTAEALSLILEQCARLGRPDSRSRQPAASRLEQRLGERLARLLISALSGDHKQPRAV